MGGQIARDWGEPDGDPDPVLLLGLAFFMERR